jgi:rod shape-determining protein MreD
VDHPILRYAIVVLSAVVIQYAVFTQFRISGVSADLLLVLAIAVGIHSGPERGAIVGFVCGLALDAMVVTPFGLGAMSYLVAGLIAGMLEAATIHSSRWLTVAIAAVSSAAGIVFFAVLGAVLGQANMLTGHLFTVLAVVATTTGLLILPVLRACRWADPEDARLRTAAR